MSRKIEPGFSHQSLTWLDELAVAPTIGFVHHQHAVGLAGLQERDRFRFTGVQLAVLSQVRSLGQCLRRNLNPTL